MTKEQEILQLVRVAFVSQLLLEELDGLNDLITYKQDFKQQTKRYKKLIESKTTEMIKAIYKADEEAITAFQNEMDRNVDIIVKKLLDEVKNR
jgi:hypothetical protein